MCTLGTVVTLIHYGDFYGGPSRLLLRSASDPTSVKENGVLAAMKRTHIRVLTMLCVSTLKWDILPLMDNYDEDEFEYEIHVHTGFAPKSGTKSRVFFRIYGSETGTGIRSMSDGIRQVRD